MAGSGGEFRESPYVWYSCKVHEGRAASEAVDKLGAGAGFGGEAWDLKLGLEGSYSQESRSSSSEDTMTLEHTVLVRRGFRSTTRPDGTTHSWPLGAKATLLVNLQINRSARLSHVRNIDYFLM